MLRLQFKSKTNALITQRCWCFLVLTKEKLFGELAFKTLSQSLKQSEAA